MGVVSWFKCSLVQYFLAIHKYTFLEKKKITILGQEEYLTSSKFPIDFIHFGVKCCEMGKHKVLKFSNSFTAQF